MFIQLVVTGYSMVIHSESLVQLIAPMQGETILRTYESGRLSRKLLAVMFGLLAGMSVKVWRGYSPLAPSWIKQRFRLRVISRQMKLLVTFVKRAAHIRLLLRRSDAYGKPNEHLN